MSRRLPQAKAKLKNPEVRRSKVERSSIKRGSGELNIHFTSYTHSDTTGDVYLAVLSEEGNPDNKLEVPIEELKPQIFNFNGEVCLIGHLHDIESYEIIASCKLKNAAKLIITTDFNWQSIIVTSSPSALLTISGHVSKAGYDSLLFKVDKYPTSYKMPYLEAFKEIKTEFNISVPGFLRIFNYPLKGLSFEDVNFLIQTANYDLMRDFNLPSSETFLNNMLASAVMSRNSQTLDQILKLRTEKVSSAIFELGCLVLTPKQLKTWEPSDQNSLNNGLKNAILAGNRDCFDWLLPKTTPEFKRTLSDIVVETKDHELAIFMFKKVEFQPSSYVLAARNGNLKLVKFIQKTNPSFIPRELHDKAFQEACANNQMATAIFISEITGLNPRKFELPLFIQACKEEYLDILDFYINTYDVSYEKVGKETLITLASNGNYEVVRWLFRKLGIPNSGLQDFLIEAFRAGNLYLAEWLMMSKQVRMPDMPAEGYAQIFKDICAQGLYLMAKSFTMAIGLKPAKFIKREDYLTLTFLGSGGNFELAFWLYDEFGLKPENLTDLPDEIWKTSYLELAFWLVRPLDLREIFDSRDVFRALSLAAKASQPEMLKFILGAFETKVILDRPQLLFLLEEVATKGSFEVLKILIEKLSIELEPSEKENLIDLTESLNIKVYLSS